jgi:hypothetical protein
MVLKSMVCTARCELSSDDSGKNPTRPDEVKRMNNVIASDTNILRGVKGKGGGLKRRGGRSKVDGRYYEKRNYIMQANG